MNKILLVGMAIGLLHSADLQAQEPVTPEPVQDALEAWQQETGRQWILRMHPGTGTGQFLYGASKEMDSLPQDDEDWFDLARTALQETRDMFLLDDSTLVEDRVKFLDLSRIGTTDKVSVQFRQAVNGIDVVNGSASVLFGTQGELLAVDTTGLPQLGGFNTQPQIGAFAAVAQAHRAYFKIEGLEATEIHDPELVIYPTPTGKSLEPRLAWSVEMHTPLEGELPAGRQLYVAADGSGELLGSDNLVHTYAQDLQGKVESWTTPGVLPDTAGNPETLHDMPFIQVTSPVGNAIADANGNFVIPYAGSNPVDVTVTYYGDWVNVNHDTGTDYSLTQSFTPGVPGTLTMNPGTTQQITAQANAYDSVNDFHAWIKEIDPTDNNMDFRVVANVNLNATCNAYFNGSSINHYLAGGGCVNTSYSTVVAHEEGHWANVIYGSGNGSDGFGEGAADVWAMYIYDTPIVGEDFSGGGFIRTGNNTRQFCGDGNGGCYGQVHADGEVLMGALWKVRRNLNTSLGNSAGDLVADTLMLAWFNTYNDGQIRTIIEEHWLSLDDNDGDIFNGTPNYADIDDGFREQGFPGIDLQLIEIVHTPLGNTQNETGPYAVDATIQSLLGGSITAARLKYTVNGGAEITVPMTNTGGNNYSADIPGQISVAFVDYYLEADDSLGNTERDPRQGANSFVVGVWETYYFNDFEGATDEGWTHAQLATQDDWQRGTPTGLSTDPVGAHSGTKCWANDLGQSGWNGEYQPDVHNYLLSPGIDLTGKTDVRLRFWRHLGVEKRNSTTSPYDEAILKVNGNEVWINPLSSDVIDNAWTLVDYDISQWADNNPNTILRFVLKSDPGVQFGGWTIDDLEIYAVKPVNNVDSIALTGDSSGVVGGTVSYDIAAAPANSPYWIYYSLNQNGTVINGQAFDIGTPFFTATTGTTDVNGNASWTSGAIPPKGGGKTVYVEARADSAGQTYDSNVVVLQIQ